MFLMVLDIAKQSCLPCQNGRSAFQNLHGRFIMAQEAKHCASISTVHKVAPLYEFHLLALMPEGPYTRVALMC
jgi:hypothetical protein